MVESNQDFVVEEEVEDEQEKFKYMFEKISERSKEDDDDESLNHFYNKMSERKARDSVKEPMR